MGKSYLSEGGQTWPLDVPACYAAVKVIQCNFGILHSNHPLCSSRARARSAPGVAAHYPDTKKPAGKAPLGLRSCA